MDVEKIKNLIQLVVETGVAELEINDDGNMIRIVNHHHHAAAPTHVHSTVNIPTAVTSAPLPPLQVTQEVPLGKVVASPMVGTFYRSTSPEAKPLVELGQEIRVGQVIGIIEAMKLMNEVVSEHSGIVQEILAENAKAVEYGQPLLRLS